ncbi:MAG: 5-aminolevulic acid synthase [Gemmobacter sp.]
MRIGVLAAGFALISHGGPAAALDAAGAEALLYPPDRVEVELIPRSFMSDDDRRLLGQALGAQKYYAAIAVPPHEGLLSPAGAVAANYHDAASAEKAALAECNAKRSGGQACVVVARVRPQGWTRRDFQLSAAATEAFAKDFVRADRPRAFAVSASSGLWGIGTGNDAAGAAVADCRARAAGAPPGDCRVVLSE